MANEYLQRTPTSTGNRRVFTWSGWVKNNKLAQSGTGQDVYFCAAGQSTLFYRTRIAKYIQTNGNDFGFNHTESTDYQVSSSALQRDFSNWIHYMIAVDTTATTSQERTQIFINGILQKDLVTSSFVPQNLQTYINGLTKHGIGVDYGDGTNPSHYTKCNFTDIFFVDGQALTPDVFGFYKDGNGYISAGSTQATDFRPGQWVPKSPRIIKAEINRRGGFGVNGFYLPMNSSNNFGADFHTTPDTILRLKEALPQPKAEIDGSGDYTNALRDDPFKQHLVLAIPFVSGGLQNGFGDYSAAIRGSGSPKIITNSNVSISNSISNYYGSSGNFNGTSSQLTTPATSDFDLSSSDFTIEMWARPNILKNGNTILSLGTGGSSLYWVLIVGQSSGAIAFGSGNGGWAWTTQPISQGDAVRINQWNHIAVVRRSNVLTTYLNGVAVGVTTNHNFGSGFGGNLHVGSYFQNYNNDGSWFDGYIQDLRIYKGVAKYTGGFDVPKPYTPVGIATWRAVPDTTANNFATLNPLKQGLTGTASITFSNGNLTSFGQRGTGTYQVYSSIGFNTGRWYAEVRQDAKSGVNANNLGIVSINLTNSSLSSTYQHTYYGYGPNANRIFNVTPSGTTNPLQDAPATYAFDNGDIISIAADLINNKVYFAKNGVWLHTGSSSFSISGSYDTSIPSGIDWCFGEPTNGGTGYTNSWNFGQNPTFSGNTTAGTYTDSNGKGLFKYQPPAGFLALCEDNLPTPAISDPGKHFKTVLYTGDGSSGRSITGLGFEPDLVWIKNRDVASWHVIGDSVRGANKALFTNNANQENTSSTTLTGTILSYDNDGFSLATDPDSTGNNGWNTTGSKHVAWCWKAGNSTQTNTNGTITSTVSVNQTAGFSIVSFTMNPTAGTYTVGHGLGKIPKFIITKQRTQPYGWWTQHASLGSTKYLALNENSTAATLTWGGDPTSSTFTINNSFAIAGTPVIAYCWAEIEGYSKFGSYVGNGSEDGPFVYCGFKPAWVMIKWTDGANGWVIMDNARSANNPSGQTIFANESWVELTDITYREMDFLSNGFKIRAGVGNERNASGGIYIFAAFAESPFTTANAK